MPTPMDDFRAGERASSLTPGQARADQLQNVAGLYRANLAPEFAAFNQRDQSLASQLGMLNGAYGQAASGQRASYNAGVNKINIQLESLNPQYQSLWRQGDYYNARQGVQDNRLGTNLDYNDYESTNYGYLRNDLFTDFQARAKQYDLDQARTDENYAYDKQKAWSDAIARGGAVSPGFQGDLSHLGSERDYAQNSLNQNRALLWSDLHKGLVQNDLQQAQLANQRQNLLYDNQLEHLDTDEQQARLRDRETELDYQAKLLNADKNVLAAQLQSGLANLNLNRAVSVGGIMDAMSSNNLQRQQLAGQVMMQALQASYMG